MIGRFSIQAAARQSGVTTHLIRAWEKRYGAVAPQRSETGHRFFSSADVERLALLHRATLAGHAIGAVAQLPTGELQEMLKSAERREEEIAPDPGAPFRAAGLGAVQRMDAAALDASLRRALVTLGHQGLLRHVIAPMAEQVGEMWRDGLMTAAHEHFFTAAAKTFLGETARQFAPPAHAPVLIACTPAHQLHELGACMAAVAAAHLGWRAIYLGPALPAAEIAGAATQNGARAVALSIVYPADDPLLPDELRALRGFLPDETAIVAGGRAAVAYRRALREIGAELATGLDDYFEKLDALRRRSTGKEAVR